MYGSKLLTDSLYCKVTASVIKHLKPEKDVLNIVEIKPYEAITGYLSGLRNKNIWLSNQASQALVSLCSKNNKLVIECSPVTLAKAIKNEVEIQGKKNCMKVWQTNWMNHSLFYGYNQAINSRQ